MISSLELAHFRNYTSGRITFGPGVNCFTGGNGQGKSNLLEAVFFLSLLRSFRTTNLNELRQWNSPFFRLTGEVTAVDELKNRLTVTYGAERALSINDTPVYRSGDFINQFICVTLIPQDLNMVQGAPSMRRRFLDIALSQYRRDYLPHLQAYHQALLARNAMLRQPEKYPMMAIRAYDNVLIREGAWLERTRLEYTAKMNEALLRLSHQLLEDNRVISLKYLAKMGPLMQEPQEEGESFEKRLSEAMTVAYDHDIQAGYTSIGPHRSDFSLLLEGMRMQNYASQGECRMGSLALRLATLELLKESRGNLQEITLIVDDVIGELDLRRKENFFHSLTEVGQVLFGCTEIPDGFPRELIRNHSQIQGGRIL